MGVTQRPTAPWAGTPHIEGKEEFVDATLGNSKGVGDSIYTSAREPVLAIHLERL
jgi:hypothetical protein